MAWAFNPFTGKLDQTADAGSGGGNPFDQSLNTTDGPTFTGVSINDGLDGHANISANGVSGQTDTGHAGNWSLSKNSVSFDNGDAGPATSLTHGSISYTPDVSVSTTPMVFTLPTSTGTLALTSDIAQTDWNATTGLAVILNKPSTFAPSAHTHSATDITSGTLPDARLSSNVVTASSTTTLTNKSISASQITGLAAVATNGAYSSLSGIPSLATVATSGAFSDLTGTSSVVTTGGTQTLTNKTLTSPAINGAASTTGVTLTCDFNHFLQQRSSTVSQAFQIFNTYTDTANYERGVIDWKTNSNALTIGTQKAGTGTARRLRLNSAENIDFYISDTSRVFQMATNGNVSFSPMTWQYYSGAGDPTTSTTPWNNGSSYCGVWRNTTTGVVKLWVNNAGTMVSVALS
jgi:hypothetical protein